MTHYAIIFRGVRVMHLFPTSLQAHRHALMIMGWVPRHYRVEPTTVGAHLLPQRFYEREEA